MSWGSGSSRIVMVFSIHNGAVCPVSRSERGGPQVAVLENMMPGLRTTDYGGHGLGPGGVVLQPWYNVFALIGL